MSDQLGHLKSAVDIYFKVQKIGFTAEEATKLIKVVLNNRDEIRKKLLFNAAEVGFKIETNDEVHRIASACLFILLEMQEASPLNKP